MKKRLSIGAVVVLLLGAAALRFGKPVEPPARPAKAGLQWPAGTRSLYSLAWTVQTWGGVGPGQLAKNASTLEFTADTEGEVAIDSLGDDGAGLRLAVSYAKFSRLDFGVAGKPASDDPRKTMAALQGHPAFVSLSPRGEVREVAFERDASPDLKRALRALVQQLQFTLPEAGEAEYDAVEPAALGALRVHYQRDGQSLQRTPAAFVTLDAVQGALDGKQKLRGGAAILLDPQGLQAVLDTEEWSYVRAGEKEDAIGTRFVFRMQRTGQAVAELQPLRQQLRLAQAQPFSAPIEDTGLDGRRDARLASEMTEEKLLLGIEHFEKGQRPGHEFIVRAGAFLRLHPEAMKALVARFRSDGLGFRGRGLILDALASAGDARAQAALREALQSPAAHGEPKDYGMLVQRLTFLDAPEPETERFLEDELTRARQGHDIPARQGAAAALGAVASHLRHAGQADLSRVAAERLRTELEDTDDPAVRLGALAGLGNAARPDDVELLRSWAANDDPRTRSQVASSLRAIDAPQARETLLELAGDGSSGVASSALASLTQQKLSDAEWAQLQRLVTAGKVASGADAALVELIRQHKDQAGQAGLAILRAIQARNNSPDNDLMHTIEMLLGQSG